MFVNGSEKVFKLEMFRWERVGIKIYINNENNDRGSVVGKVSEERITGSDKVYTQIGSLG